MFPRLQLVKSLGLLLLVLLSMAITVASGVARGGSASSQVTAAYIGFDRNEYPGEASLGILRRTFYFSSFWLNTPPGEKNNSWRGKRDALRRAGFGFLVLFNGRTAAEIKSANSASALGEADAASAIAAAREEGFPSGTIIFLDQEEGGRLLPEQRTYLHTWVDRVNAESFQAGVYCSGIPFEEGNGVEVVTAEDIRKNAGGRSLVYWVANDACPPSPGCALLKKPPLPSDSGVSYADVWQFAQSPRRSAITSRCPANYDTDGNCYPPALDGVLRVHLDLNTARSEDPSHGR